MLFHTLACFCIYLSLSKACLLQFAYYNVLTTESPLSHQSQQFKNKIPHHTNHQRQDI